MVKNPPTNAGDAGSVPALERSYMLWGYQAGEPQLLSPHAWTLCSTREAIAMRSPGTATREQPSLTTTRGKPARSNRDPVQP